MMKYYTEKHIRPKNAFKILLYRKKVFANGNFCERCPILLVFNIPASFDNVLRELKEIVHFSYEEHDEILFDKSIEFRISNKFISRNRFSFSYLYLSSKNIAYRVSKPSDLQAVLRGLPIGGSFGRGPKPWRNRYG